MSFLNNFRISPVGVTIRKKIKPIIIGDTIEPRSNPNLNQDLFKGKSNLEFKTPNNKNITAIGIGQILILFPFIRGQIDIIKKISEKNKPKLLFELIFILSFFII